MNNQKKKKRGWRIFWISFVSILIIGRLLLPYFVLKYVNKTLAHLDDYYGHAEDVDIALYRGAYKIKGLNIQKIENIKNKSKTIPFFETPEIDLSVEWKAILKGSFVGEIYVESPILNFVKGTHKDEDVKENAKSFDQVIGELMPLTINHFEIANGQIHYIDQTSSPKVDLEMTELEIKANNLSNVNDSAKLLPASLVANGNVYKGKFNVNVDFTVFQKDPTFDLTASVTNVNLPSLNPFLQAYGNFDVKKGNFGLYTEFAAKNGFFNGYVKPIIKDLDVVQWTKEEGNFKQILWETLIGTTAEIFQNQKKEQLATKVPIGGKFEKPNTSIWIAVNYVLKNAFVNALKPAIDYTINIANVEEIKEDKTFLQKVFGSKKEKDKNRDGIVEK